MRTLFLMQKSANAITSKKEDKTDLGVWVDIQNPVKSVRYFSILCIQMYKTPSFKKVSFFKNYGIFQSSITILETLVIALGAGLGAWGVINLLEGYGNDNSGAKSHGMKHLIPSLM